MIRAEFFARNGKPVGFHVTGHSGTARRGQDIICAAVSSAAYLTANTITEVAGVQAEISAADGDMLLRTDEKDAASCGILLRGFEIHMKALSRQYPESIAVIDTEV